MSRAFATVVTVVLLGATLSPLRRTPADDGFPLSTYPMFAWKRPTRYTMSYPLGVTAAGERRYLSPAILGTGEVLQARAVVERAVAARRPGLDPLCARIAERVAARAAYADVTHIRIVTGTHDAVEFLARDQIGAERELVRCPVVRGGPRR